MQRERRLGKGLGQLLSGGGRTRDEQKPVSPPPAAAPAPVAEAGGRRVGKLPIGKIKPNPWQPRVEFTAAELDELMSSLKEQGLLQPITVRSRTTGYELVAGERRLRAAKELGWTEIEALVVDATDQQMLEWAVIENLQRASLNPVETARSFRRLIDEFSLTQDEAARRLGQSRANLANTLRLLDLPTEVLAMVANHTVAPGAARALLGLSDRAQQKAVADRVAKEQLSVRQVEELVRAMKKSGVAAIKVPTVDPNRVAAAEDLQRALGTKVAIVGSQQKGSIRIEYHSSRELQDLFRKLVKLGETPED